MWLLNGAAGQLIFLGHRLPPINRVANITFLGDDMCRITIIARDHIVAIIEFDLTDEGIETAITKVMLVCG